MQNFMISFGYVVSLSRFKTELVILASFWHHWRLISFILWRHYNLFLCISANINFMSVISLPRRYWIRNNRWIYSWYIFNLIPIACTKTRNIRTLVKCDYCELSFVFRISPNYCSAGGLWVRNWNIWKNTKPNFPPSCYSIVRWFNDATGMNMGLRS